MPNQTASAEDIWYRFAKKFDQLGEARNYSPQLPKSNHH